MPKEQRQCTLESKPEAAVQGLVDSMAMAISTTSNKKTVFQSLPNLKR